MKKNGSGKRGLLDPPPPEKFGWIRRFCGRGIFREIWKNRFVVLRADQLFICEKEVKELGRADEVLDLSDYDRCEEIRKNKTRSKKNHSKFRVQRCSSPGNTVPNLVFLAVSPEEKESWIQVLNAAITRAKNQILDEVTVEDAHLSHLTRDRVKIPQTRRLPTRGHLLAVASSSDGALTLDLIQEDDPLSDPRPPLCACAEASGKSHSLPREVQSPLVGKKSCCASIEQILTPQDHKDPKNHRDPKNHKDHKDPKNHKDPKDHKDHKDPKNHKDPKDHKNHEDHKDPKNHKDQKDPKDQKDHKNHKDHKDPKDQKDHKDPKDQKDHKDPPMVARLQELIAQKLQDAERMLTEVRGGAGLRGGVGVQGGAEAERILIEATETWSKARDVLQEVKELQDLYRQL